MRFALKLYPWSSLKGGSIESGSEEANRWLALCNQSSGPDGLIH